MNSGFFGTKRTVHNIEVPHKRGICKERIGSIWVRLNYKPLKTDDVAVHEFFDPLLSNTDSLSSFFLFQTYSTNVSVVLYSLNAYLFKGDVQILDFFHIGRFYFLHIKRDWTVTGANSGKKHLGKNGLGVVTTFIITSNIFTGVPGGKPARSLKKGTTSAKKYKWKGNIDVCIQVKKRKEDKKKQKYNVNEEKRHKYFHLPNFVDRGM